MLIAIYHPKRSNDECEIKRVACIFLALALSISSSRRRTFPLSPILVFSLSCSLSLALSVILSPALPFSFFLTLSYAFVL